MPKKNTIEDCRNLAKTKNGIFLSDSYLGNQIKYLWQCANGHQFEMRAVSVTTGQWCSICEIFNKKERAKVKRNSIEECKQLALKNNGECLSVEYKDNKTKLFWKCDKGHEFLMSFNKVQKGRWCQLCSHDRQKKKIFERYGVEYPAQNATIRAKQEQTNLKLYGFKNANQNKEIALKTAKSLNNSYILCHWRTNEEIVCVGSWEKRVVEFLNKNRIDYFWQPQTFQTPFLTPNKSFSTYRPDLYLTSENKWIEIKGYFRDDALEKWIWFHEKYPNSELWNKEKLKELEIL